MRVCFPALVRTSLVLVSTAFVPVQSSLAQTPPAPANPAVQNNCQRNLRTGLQFYNAGRFETALPFFERAVKECNSSAESLYFLARNQMRLGLMTAAIENLRRSIAQNATFINSYIALAQAYTDSFRFAENREAAKGNLDQALNVLRDAERVNSKYAPIYSWRAVVLGLQGQYDRAIEAANRAIALDDDPALRSTLASLYVAEGKPDEALKIYNDAVNKYPKDSDLRIKYGTFLLARKDCTAALAHLNQAAILAPGNAEVYVYQGQALECLKSWKPAGAAYENAVALSPVRYPEAYAGLGRVYLELGDAQKARFNLTKAVALEPQNASFRYWLGKANEVLGDKAGAKAQCQKALELQNDFKEAQECVARNQ